MNSLHDFGPAFRARAQRNEKKYSGYWLFACGAMYTLWLVMLFDGAVSV